MIQIGVKAEHSYDVLIGCKWAQEFDRLIQGRARVAVVFSVAMKDRLPLLTHAHGELHLIAIPDAESGKDATTLEFLWNALGSHGFTRSDLIVAIGGGATTDITGFAAATWLRGIDWVAIPTTLAGMVDAAVGGKTGMNSRFGKNLIGAFHSPRQVVVDLAWLSTLSDRDFAAGMAEVIKCGFIADPTILEIIEGRSLHELRASERTVESLIHKAVALKARVVGEDFKDNFAREILNYGHTMGHAIELHSKYSLRHGEAVAIGMVFVAELARIKGLLAEDVVARHCSVLESIGLPTTYARTALPELMPLLFLDKKARGNLLRFVGISQIGQTLRIEGVSPAEISAAYERVAL